VKSLYFKQFYPIWIINFFSYIFLFALVMFYFLDKIWHTQIKQNTHNIPQTITIAWFRQGDNRSLNQEIKQILLVIISWRFIIVLFICISDLQHSWMTEVPNVSLAVDESSSCLPYAHCVILLEFCKMYLVIRWRGHFKLSCM